MWIARFLLLFLWVTLLVMIFALTACGGGEGDDEGKTMRPPPPPAECFTTYPQPKNCPQDK